MKKLYSHSIEQREFVIAESVMSKRINTKIIEEFVSDWWNEIKSLNNKRREIVAINDVRRVRQRKQVEFTKTERAKIDTYYRENYGKKIPHAWHKKYASFTGNFDESYYPELLYIPSFERFENFDQNYCYALSDKNITPLIARAIGVETPDTIFSCAFGLIRNSDYEIVSPSCFELELMNIGRVFIKPTTDTGSGRGCILVDMADGIDKISGYSVSDIMNTIGENFVIQKVLVCHSSIRNIYPDSVNTFRIITYRWTVNGLPVINHFPIIMRIGRNGNYLDNAHKGGMFIAVNDDGAFHKTAFTEFGERFERHPDTQLQFEGYNISLVPNVLESAVKMHIAIPQIGVINWDFTIDERGKPILIEANTLGGSIWLSEIAHGKGAFGEYTADVLKWIQKMEHTNPKNRHKYTYGKML